MTPTLADQIDALLAQTQCTKCGYEGCRPYAEALAAAQTAHNRCVPGGVSGIARLSALLDRAPLPLDPACGVEAPRRVAWIDPQACIGCTKCIAACPVDAIIGAPKRMHTVIEAQCTGCDLCLPPCPVDCIEMRASPDPQWSDDDAARARAHYHARLARLALDREQTRGRANADAGGERKRALVEAASRRARALLARAGERR